MTTDALTVPASRPTHREVRAPLITTPVRAGLLVGVSAVVYAGALAAVAGLQADTSAAVAAERASGLDAVTRARTANDELAAAVAALDAGARRVVDGYGTASDDAAAYQARLDELAALVAEVQGTAAALPARIRLPAVATHGAISGPVRASRAPATSGRTGASGG